MDLTGLWLLQHQNTHILWIQIDRRYYQSKSLHWQIHHKTIDRGLLECKSLSVRSLHRKDLEDYMFLICPEQSPMTSFLSRCLPLLLHSFFQARMSIFLQQRCFHQEEREASSLLPAHALVRLVYLPFFL